jgi:hypothetical protein
VSPAWILMLLPSRSRIGCSSAVLSVFVCRSLIIRANTLPFILSSVNRRRTGPTRHLCAHGRSSARRCDRRHGNALRDQGPELARLPCSVRHVEDRTIGPADATGIRSPGTLIGDRRPADSRSSMRPRRARRGGTRTPASPVACDCLPRLRRRHVRPRVAARAESSTRIAHRRREQGSDLVRFGCAHPRARDPRGSSPSLPRFRVRRRLTNAS